MVDRPKWYIADPQSEEPQGPLNTAEIVARLKKGQLKMEDFIWCDEYQEGDWKRVFEVPEFKSSLSKQLKLATPKKKSTGQRLVLTLDRIGQKNVYRRFPRVDISANVILHDDTRYIKVQALDISEQGVFVAIPDLTTFSKGQELTITLIDAAEIGTFSVKGVILRITDREDRKGYGLIFLRLNPNIRARIAKYVLAKLQAQAEGPPSDRQVG